MRVLGGETARDKLLGGVLIVSATKAHNKLMKEKTRVDVCMGLMRKRKFQ